MLVGRTFSVNQGDLTGDNKDTFRHFCFKVGEVRGNDCMSFFNGMYISQDKLAGLVRKWHTLVETYEDVTTRDGSVWRIFLSGVTKRKANSTGKTCYLQTSEVKAIRKIMNKVIQEETNGVDTDKLMTKLSTESIGRAVEEECVSIHPMTVMVRKVKPLKNMMVMEIPSAPGATVGMMEEETRFEMVAEH